ncbi:MAG: hypothetical protein ACI8Y4_004521 [Candidatus Poriferisodalaceae bacterium]
MTNVFSDSEVAADIAGLQPRERWADWHRNPFTAESASHVSVWEKLAQLGRR